MTLYGEALLPDSRGDILGLLETFDSLLNRAETVRYALRCQRVVISDFLNDDFKTLIDSNNQSYYLVRKSVDALLHNPRTTLHTTKEVDKKESAYDRIERNTIIKIFESEELDMGTRVMARDLVVIIGSISDRAERTADRFSIVAIKRQI